MASHAVNRISEWIPLLWATYSRNTTVFNLMAEIYISSYVVFVTWWIMISQCGVMKIDHPTCLQQSWSRTVLQAILCFKLAWSDQHSPMLMRKGIIECLSDSDGRFGKQFTTCCSNGKFEGFVCDDCYNGKSVRCPPPPPVHADIEWLLESIIRNIRVLWMTMYETDILLTFVCLLCKWTNAFYYVRPFNGYDLRGQSWGHSFGRVRRLLCYVVTLL
jgi:hypothetical protein